MHQPVRGDPFADPDEFKIIERRNYTLFMRMEGEKGEWIRFDQPKATVVCDLSKWK